MESGFLRAAKWLLGAEPGEPGHLGPRWIFLRALGVIFFSAFYSLVYQAEGLVGPNGILPANIYLDAVGHSMHGLAKVRFAPSVFWISSTDQAMAVVCWMGMIAAALLFFNLCPRLMTAICFVGYLSFVAVLQDFSNYQSDGMLLEAGFLCLFFAPWGWRPGWGAFHAPSRACTFLLLWEWFRIYFESGMVKMLGGDPEWRHLTAMYEYYQNGPLPTWIGYYVQHAPHWFHRCAALATLVMELGVVLMLFLPRRFRLVCFFIVTLWEIGVISTANYAFLNYLVLALGFLLLDDKFLVQIAPKKWFRKYHIMVAMRGEDTREAAAGGPPAKSRNPRRRFLRPVWMTLAGICLAWIFYATSAELIWMFWPGFPVADPAVQRVAQGPVRAIEPFRIANQFGLFGVMTRGRYEIEFQGSNDGGKTWTAYPFRYKPQAVNEAPRIYAPYQPRFDWNLWFASLGDWRQYQFVLATEEALLDGSHQALSLFGPNPFPEGPPQEIRSVMWQYWFTSLAEKRETGDWWRRRYLGLYAPRLEREGNGRFAVVQMPGPLDREGDADEPNWP